MFTLEHIGLAAKDPNALRAWYERVLGAQLVWDIAKDPPAVLITLGGTIIEIYSADSAHDATRNNKVAGWRHLALRVDSIEHAKNLLIDRGVEFTEPVKPAGGGGRVLFFNDPEGNLLHLVERLSVGFQ
ncbi:MAG TPA: VOC family protein [Verrucomicrobiae bacterium]